MALKIISGTARGIVLSTPDGRSMRPTSGRAREALFSSLGDLTGKRFADIFAGSGAIGLEAASRGAASVLLLESNARHVNFIEQNIAKLQRSNTDCNITVLKRKFSISTLQALPRADIWFFDPPYAESAEFFKEIASHAEMLGHVWGETLLIWEMPDTAEARAPFQHVLSSAGSHLECNLKNLGGNDFLFCRIKVNL